MSCNGFLDMPLAISAEIHRWPAFHRQRRDGADLFAIGERPVIFGQMSIGRSSENLWLCFFGEPPFTVINKQQHELPLRLVE